MDIYNHFIEAYNGLKSIREAGCTLHSRNGGTIVNSFVEISGLNYRSARALLFGLVNYDRSRLSELLNPYFYTINTCINLYINGEEELIPSTFYENTDFAKKVKLSRIPDNFLSGDCKIDTFTILPGVKYIGTNAFRGCTSLKIEYIPASVAYIGENAFRGCLRLTNITMKNSVKYLGRKAFMDCENLVYVSGIKKLTYVSPKTFKNCANLTLVDLDPYVYVGKKAFSGCSRLNHMNSCLLGVGSKAFENCFSLRSIRLATKDISLNAFTGCPQISSGFHVFRHKNSVLLK